MTRDDDGGRTMDEMRTTPAERDEQTRSFRARIVVLVVAVAVLTGIGASLAWATTRPAPIGNGVVVIETSLADGEAAGTGMVLSSSGEVLTNNHVIRGATAIKVVLPGSGRSYTAKVLGYSVSKDVAVLEASGASNLKTVSFGNSSTVRVGQAVTATGNAGGTGTLTSSSGRVTALARAITVGDDGGGGQRLTGLVETSAELEPGDSGGPLFNAAHKVIGMNTAASVGYVFRGTRDADGYAIPINSAITIATQIEAGKPSATVHVGPTAFLGVSVGSDDLGGTGAVVAGIVPGGAAAAAGLTAGDVITSVDGRAVSSSATLRAALLLEKPGARVAVTYLDATTGASQTVSVTLGSGPPQ
jgi:S1-C subfamily serine protease